MNTFINSSSFGILTIQQINTLSQISPIFTCQATFLSQPQPSPFVSLESLNQNQRSQSQIQNISRIIELRDDYLLELEYGEEKKILSGFKFDYSINFEIVRDAVKAPCTLGVPKYVEFTFGGENPYKISIVPKLVQKLQTLSRILQKKYIVQLGFKDNFKAIKILGKGVTATVYKAARFRDLTEVAIKSFKRSVYFAAQNGKLSFQKQFKILSMLSHKYICSLEGVFETQNSTYIVMQNLAHSLFGWLQKYGFPQIEQARKMIFQLLKGIQHLHEKGIMHRDLKLENIMVRKDSKQDPEIVIVDLGLAQFINAEKYLYTRCGTPGYVAPEVLQAKNGETGKYNEKCDIFSIGVIFHILLFKRTIFEGSEVKQVIAKNSECNINYSAEYFKSLCADGLDLLKRMLEKDPSKRISAKDAITHEFLRSVNVCESSLKMDSTFQSINNIGMV